MGFVLPCGGIKIQVQHVQHAQKGPDVCCCYRVPLKIADDLAQFAAIVNGFVRDKAFRRQAPLELAAVTCRTGTV